MIEVIDYVAQGMVFITGMLSVYLVSSPDPQTRMKAGLIGLAGEPFWLTTTIINEQWGISLLVLVYTFNWGLVYINNYKMYHAAKY